MPSSFTMDYLRWCMEWAASDSASGPDFNTLGLQVAPSQRVTEGILESFARMHKAQLEYEAKMHEMQRGCSERMQAEQLKFDERMHEVRLEHEARVQKMQPNHDFRMAQLDKVSINPLPGRVSRVFNNERGDLQTVLDAHCRRKEGNQRDLLASSSPSPTFVIRKLGPKSLRER
jgi:hypothetical protein